MTEDTPDPPACHLLLLDKSMWRKENLEPLEATALLVSPDPEVTQLPV